MRPTSEFLHFLMTAALEEAQKAAAADEVPVGAVIAVGDQIIARAHNLIETRQDSNAHAEVLAISLASSVQKNWRLTEAILAVTLEPCSMCAGAIKLARIPILVYGRADTRAGAVGSLYDLTADSRTGPPPRVIAGIQEEKSAEILRSFFVGKRKK